MNVTCTSSSLSPPDFYCAVFILQAEKKLQVEVIKSGSGKAGMHITRM